MKLVRGDNILVQDLGEELVFLDLNTEQYLGLNGAGKAMWYALLETPSRAEAEKRLLEIFEVDPATLEADLDELTGRLLEHGLLKQVEA